MTILAPKLSRTFIEIGNQMQNHKIETNSELIYEDGSIWSTLIFIKIIGSYTLWFPLPPSEVLCSAVWSEWKVQKNFKLQNLELSIIVLAHEVLNSWENLGSLKACLGNVNINSLTCYMPNFNSLDSLCSWSDLFEPNFVRNLAVQDFSYRKNNLLISQLKHMLWVLKRTVSMRQFLWAPKTYAQNYG